MDTTSGRRSRRILIVDDNEHIHNDFYEILNPIDTLALDEAEASFLGRPRASLPPVKFELTSVYQGADALEAIRRGVQEGAPYALAFVDMRMPPGWDGLETLSRMWEEDRALQAVICSAYSDCSWDEVTARFGQTDKLLILKKPFDPIEVRQLASALTEKWIQHRDAASAARRVAVQYAATRALVESSALADAGPKLLRAIGEEFGWPFGAVWLSEEGRHRLSPVCTWSAAPALEDLATATARDAGASVETSPRRVLASGQTSWSVVDSERGARDAAATRAGLRSVLHVPIRTGAIVLGVLEFFDPSGRKPEDGVFDTLSEICAKLGQFIQNKRVESALRRSEADNRGLLHALPDAILRLGRDGTCLDYKAPRTASPSAQPSFAVKRPIRESLPVEVATELMDHLERALAQDTTHVFEYQQSLGSEPREFEARLARIDGSEAVVIIRDVTEARRAKLEAEQRRTSEDMLRAQSAALLALSTPFIPITDDIVVIPLIGTLSAPRMQQIQATVVNGISAHQTRVAILDLTGVTELHPEGAMEIMRVAQAAQLLGTVTIVTGMRPDVARLLVDLGQDLGGLVTHRTLQSGVAHAMRAR